MAKKPASPVVEAPAANVDLHHASFIGWTVSAWIDGSPIVLSLALGPDATEDDLKRAVADAYVA